MGEPTIPEEYAAAILLAAIKKGRASELLMCLFGGGSCTLSPSGALVMVDGDTLAKLTAVLE
jgi:hypothetical protein